MSCVIELFRKAFKKAREGGGRIKRSNMYSWAFSNSFAVRPKAKIQTIVIQSR
jgi:hypothetical protein